MLSDDTYRTRLAATIREMGAWVDAHAGCAEIERSETAAGWRIRAQPHAINACPFELLVRRDQYYDLLIANEAYEDQAIESLSFFHPLVEAIAAGQVIVRRFQSAATALPIAVETLVTFADGSLWRGIRESTPGKPDAGTVALERHFVPYARAA